MKKEWVFSKNTNVSVTAFLHALRAIHPPLEDICQHGSCFKLYLLLKEVWPDAEAWYDGDHVLTKIGDLFYDIRGEVVPGQSHYPMKSDPSVFNNATSWKA